MAFDDELNRRRAERERERKFRQAQGKWLKIAAIGASSVLILCAAAVLITFGWVKFAQSTPPEQTVPPATTLPPETEPPKPDSVIHFAVGGDINITDKTVSAGATAGGYDYSGTLMELMPVFANADLSAVNFEGNVVGAPYGTATHSAPQQMLSALKNMGVDFVQTANSMTIFNGINGMRSTLQAVKAAGMTPLGSFSSNQEFRETGGYVIREVNGIRVALVAFTKGMDGMGLPEGNENTVNLLYKDYNSAYQKVDEGAIASLLLAVSAQKPDVTIALLHWGSEYNSKISTTQEKIRDLMLSAGVNVIIGTHSHYVQEVHFDAEKGNLVAYGIGDLLGDGDNVGTDYSVVLNLEITKSGADGKTKVTGYEYTPVYLDTTNGIKLRQISPAIAAYEANAIGKVTPEVYAAMKSALEKISGRMK